MSVFTYFEDNSIRCLFGTFNSESYRDAIVKRKFQLVNIVNNYLDNQYNIQDIGILAYQRLLILNQRFEKWKYPVFSIHINKSTTSSPIFYVTKGLNKIYANFVARRPLADIPVLVINYGKATSNISIVKDIYYEHELAECIGVPVIFLKLRYHTIDNERYLVVEHIKEDKPTVSELDFTFDWLNTLKLMAINRRIKIQIVDVHNSEISNTGNLFELVNNHQPLVPLPLVVERTTHIREYKNLLHNATEDLTTMVLITNKKIKIDLLDIIWFLNSDSSDYVSEDRSYSILAPGKFKADSVLPRSE